jgi:glyoxylase-like metal-dependent hydrolase (beta-lactamase superfamily II)
MPSWPSGGIFTVRKYLLLLALLAATAWQATGAVEPKPPLFALHDLGHGVWAAISPPKSPAGANAGFVIGADGVLVIDTFEDPAAAKALLTAIRAKTRAPIRYVVDTHYHLDHTAGNDVFAAAGATVMAQRNVRTWERTENLKFFGPRPTAKQKQFVATLGLPTVTYADGITIWLGDHKIIVRVLPGHTGGDSAVIVPDARVVFTGDLFWNHTLPNLIDADTRAQIASNDAFVHDYPDSTFVPGHGGVGKAADVQAFRDYLVALRKAVTVAQRSGKTGGALTDAVLPEIRKRYAGWGWFKYFARHNIEQTAAELDGTKHVPVPGVP